MKIVRQDTAYNKSVVARYEEITTPTGSAFCAQFAKEEAQRIGGTTQTTGNLLRGNAVTTVYDRSGFTVAVYFMEWPHPMKERIELDSHMWIDVDTEGNTADSHGMRDAHDPDDVSQETITQHNAAIDALEYLVLAQASAGIDITTETYRQALRNAYDAIVACY